ncbi:MAG: hypothetical protein COA88_06405 [Kordia sp.]|nr:MAG: hypothetical protein COA88_06405 [Kordia sp.]
MKIQHILFLFVLISCSQNTKEKKETIVKAKDVVDFVIDSPKKVDDVSFDKIISEIKTKETPLIDSTNFDNFKEIDIYNKQEIEALKLEKVYPNFYKEGYNYKATASYKIEFSKEFHSIVLTILKGEHEMESVLINYDLNGNIIDSKVISYDEIAEGLFKIETKIEKNKITINYTEWTDEKHQLTDIYEVKANGELTFISEEEIMINNVIKQLGLTKQKIKTDLLTYVIFGDSKESIIVIPEIVDEGEHYFELNSHILIVDSTTGDIKHRYFESYKNNNWASDAVKLERIRIDTAHYIVAENRRAFGVSVFFYGSSHANPYSNETISLFVKSGSALKNILKNYDVINSRGEWDTNCAGEFTDIKSILIMSKEKTNGYFNILVKSKITESKAYINENGDCDSKDKITAETAVLKFNGKTYE